MFWQAILQSERLQCGRKGCVAVELRLPWVSNRLTDAEVFNGREIIKGFQDIHGSQAKIITGVVTVLGSRKVVWGCADTRNSCSAGHYRLIT